MPPEHEVTGSNPVRGTRFPLLFPLRPECADDILDQTEMLTAMGNSSISPAGIFFVARYLHEGSFFRERELFPAGYTTVGAGCNRQD